MTRGELVRIGQLIALTAAVVDRVLRRRQDPELASRTSIETTGRLVEVERERERLRPAMRDA